MSGTLTKGMVFHTHAGEEVTPKTLYMGLELEVEARKGYDQSHLDAACTTTDVDKLWIITNDALTRGREFVSQPMTWKYIQNDFPWKMVEQLQPIAASFNERGGYNAGVHIHLSQAAFDKDHLFRFTKFHFANRKLITQVGGRDTSMGKFTYPEYDYGRRAKTPTDEQLRAVTDSGGSRQPDRYVCVNLTHGGGNQTAELRYFRSTTNPLRLRGYLEWARAVYQYTKHPAHALTEAGIRGWIVRYPRTYANAIAVMNGVATHADELYPGHTREYAFKQGY